MLTAGLVGSFAESSNKEKPEILAQTQRLQRHTVDEFIDHAELVTLQGLTARFLIMIPGSLKKEGQVDGRHG